MCTVLSGKNNSGMECHGNVHSDSQRGQAEIYLKDISWQRQMCLIYLFKTLLSGMALGDIYLISQWTLSRMWE